MTAQEQANYTQFDVNNRIKILKQSIQWYEDHMMTDHPSYIEDKKELDKMRDLYPEEFI